MSHSLHPLVRNQILFREVNERVREALGTQEGAIEFVCECSNDDCIETVALDVRTYERIRSHANHFFVTSGHENLDVDRVVDQGNNYVLVEKKVEVERVLALDPRTRGD